MKPSKQNGMPVDAEHHPLVESSPARPNYVGIGFLAAMILLGIAYTMMAFGYGWSAETNPMGPGAAPATLGMLLIAGCLFVLGQEIRNYRQARSAAGAGTGAEFSPPAAARELVKPLMIVLILLAGLMLAPVVGLTISMTAAVLVIAVVIEKVKPMSAVIMGAVTALMLWGIFQQILNVRFPDSLVGI